MHEISKGVQISTLLNEFLFLFFIFLSNNKYCTLNLHKVMCQSYVNKVGKMKKKIINIEF